MKSTLVGGVDDGGTSSYSSMTDANEASVSLKSEASQKVAALDKLGPQQSPSRISVISNNFIFLAGDDKEDGSQAWCIVICCFLVNTVVMGFLKCMGILIIELQKSYKATPAHVSVLVSITSCLNCIAGPLACYLVLKFSARSIAFMGTVLVSLGLMLSWFATSITFLYFSIGVLVGLGSGFTYSPGLILIGNYFQKNRGMANGVVVSGSPVGGMIMPYMLNFLINYLDCRGALLVLGGLMMNAVVCTLSYKPYRPPIPKKILIPTTVQAEGTDTVSIQTSDSSSVTVIRGPNEDERESDESSGPEFIIDEDTGFLKSQHKIKKQASSASTGSVIVYKINEKYGQPRHKEDPAFIQPHKILSKPPFWSQPEQDVNKMRKLSGTGQSVEPKASQTEIHPKNKDENRIMRPFTGLLRRVRGSGVGGSGLLNSNGKFTSPVTPTPNSKCMTTAALQPSSTRLSQESKLLLQPGSLDQSQTEPQTIGGASLDLTIRNRKSAKEKKEPPSPPTVSTKRLPPYIMSLDHSCVIMWSTDNLTKGQQLPAKPSSARTVAKAYEGFGDQIVSQKRTDNVHGKDISQELLDVPPPEKRKSYCSRCIRWIKNSPLSCPTYLILLFSNASTAVATTNILLLIPALGEHRGLSKAESSTVYVIISLTDFISRLCGAFIYDRNYLRPQVIFASGLLFAGISSFFIGGADTFLKFSCFGGMFGFSCGLHIGIFGALLAEVVGIPMLPSGYAFCMILNGILQFSFINISGKILSSNSEAYTNLYVFYGVCLVVGGSLWFGPFMAARVRKLKCRTKPTQLPVEEITILNCPNAAFETTEQKPL